jgi:hypothetical protein
MSVDGSLRDSCDDGGVTDNGSDKYNRPGLVHRHNESRFDGTDSPTVVLRAILSMFYSTEALQRNWPKKVMQIKPGGVLSTLFKSGSRREEQTVEPSESELFNEIVTTYIP